MTNLYYRYLLKYPFILLIIGFFIYPFIDDEAPYSFLEAIKIFIVFSFCILPYYFFWSGGLKDKPWMVLLGIVLPYDGVILYGIYGAG